MPRVEITPTEKDEIIEIFEEYSAYLIQNMEDLNTIAEQKKDDPTFDTGRHTMLFEKCLERVQKAERLRHMFYKAV